jgi:hypothetical protein
MNGERPYLLGLVTLFELDLFIGMKRQAIVAVAGRINKFQPDISHNSLLGSYTTPSFKRVGHDCAAAFDLRPLIGSSCRMGFDIIRFAPLDIGSSSICPPARYVRCKMLVSVSNAPIILFFESIGGNDRIGVFPFPKLFYEAVFLCQILYIEERLSLVHCNNVFDIVQPLKYERSPRL